MSTLLRAASLIGKPVLTLQGDSPLEIKDVVFDKQDGALLGFTLRKHGYLGGPVDERLAWKDVHGLGPDAVVVADESCLAAGGDEYEAGGDVTGDQVITENGTDLGRVVEIVLSTGSSAEIVGFEIVPTAANGRDDDLHVFLPLPDTLAISGEKIVVPDAAAAFVRDDLSGFGGAVEDFRAQLREDR